MPHDRDRGRRPSWRRLPLLLAALMLLGAAAPLPPAGPPKPRRVVSVNLCADRLVLQLADRAQVVSVSAYAADPTLSTVAGLAAGLPVNQANVEEIVTLHPDLVVTGSFQDRATVAMVRRLGIRVHQLPMANSLAEVESAIAGLAAELGVPERGQRMIADLRARLAALPHPDRPRLAAVFQAGGWSAGRGTLEDDLLARAGYANLAARTGLTGFGALPLETLVAGHPDLIVVESMGEEAPSMAGALLDHPALVATGARRVTVPTRLWGCPDPAVADAAALIARAAP
jgi:iron complex transport system substrate-binding protein